MRGGGVSGKQLRRAVSKIPQNAKHPRARSPMHRTRRACRPPVQAPASQLYTTAAIAPAQTTPCTSRPACHCVRLVAVEPAEAIDTAIDHIPADSCHETCPVRAPSATHTCAHPFWTDTATAALSDQESSEDEQIATQKQTKGRKVEQTVPDADEQDDSEGEGEDE